VGNTWSPGGVAALVLALIVAPLALPTASEGPKPADRPPADEAAVKAHLQAEYGRLPLAFEANHGQVDARVQFLARGRGYVLYLTPEEAVFTRRAPRRRPRQPRASRTAILLPRKP
jgi:hypothetical protein